MKLLVAVDFSEQSKIIVDEAEKLARSLQAEVLLLHVIPPSSPIIELPLNEEEIDSGDMQPEDVNSNELVKLQNMAEQLQQQGIAASVLIAHNDEITAIIGESRRVGAELIMLGSHGHGALFHLLVGSVSEGVIRQATCPVIIVPLKKS